MQNHANNKEPALLVEYKRVIQGHGCKRIEKVLEDFLHSNSISRVSNGKWVKSTLNKAYMCQQKNGNYVLFLSYDICQIGNKDSKASNKKGTA